MTQETVCTDCGCRDPKAIKFFNAYNQTIEKRCRACHTHYMDWLQELDKLKMEDPDSWLEEK